MKYDIKTLRLHWDERWPNITPRAEELPKIMQDRWARFYTLPNGKRYPQNESELGEIVSRHNKLLEDLKPDEIIIITCEWDDQPTPYIKHSKVDPTSNYWQSIKEFSEDKNCAASYRHLFVSIKRWESGTLNDLLQSVANDDTAGVIVAPSNFLWLYHPYDGGADIIFPTTENKAQFIRTHKNWLAR
jgi:hypothetical protein